MTDESINQPRSDRSSASPADDAALPTEEKHQPDPLLQISTGRMGAGGITLVAVVIAFILGVVFYGLNDRAAAEHPAAATSTPSMKPAAGGKANLPSKSAPQTNSFNGSKG